MTDSTDRPVSYASPGAHVADLLALLRQLPAEAGQIDSIGIATYQCQPGSPYLTLAMASVEAAQVFADRLGVPPSKNTHPPLTQWSGSGAPTPWGHYADVTIIHDARVLIQHRIPGSSAMIGHLARLHEALTVPGSPINLADLWHITVTASGLYLQTTSAATARALTPLLCPGACWPTATGLKAEQVANDDTIITNFRDLR